ncbi:MAG: hypothetical protein NBV63_01070 [Candidatus Pacebacteria bacterium]|nr:hypothetical protein [Candidatus Paceibacterota bacterium]
MKETLIGIGSLLVLLTVFFGFNAYIYSEKQRDDGLFADPRNGLYFISGNPVQLIDGVAQVPAAPDSASMITTQYFGNEARGDFDGDGDQDIAFLITQDGGGSGIFFFLAGAINEGGTYRGTNAMLIGDRIAPQNTQIGNFTDTSRQYVVVNYADRAPGEPMAQVPSVGKSLYAKYSAETNDFGELVQDFEGESR